MYYKIKKIVDEMLGITSVLEQPRDKKFGHFALPTFSLAKSLKKSPQDIAQDFAKKLEEVASDSAGKQMLEFAIAMYEKNNSGK